MDSRQKAHSHPNHHDPNRNPTLHSFPTTSEKPIFVNPNPHTDKLLLYFLKAMPFFVTI
jgi:hypothetical protein